MTIRLPTHQGTGNDNRTQIQSHLDACTSGDTVRLRNAANGGSDEWLISAPTSYVDTDTGESDGLYGNPGALEITVSGITFQLDPNVILYAKSGSFLGKFQCMVRAKAKTDLIFQFGAGSKIKMRKADYGTYGSPTSYTPSEHRHCLCLLQCDRVEGIGNAEAHLIDAGGDGLFVNGKGDRGPSALRTPSTYINFTDVWMDGNLRQGVSVINVNHMHLKRCEFNNTLGVAPQSGIDFEPELPQDRLADIILEDCNMQGNASRNLFINVENLEYRTDTGVTGGYAQSAPIDITVKQGALTEGSRDPWGISVSMAVYGPPSGTIRFAGVRAYTLGYSGIAILHWRVDSDLKVIFDDCHLDHVSDLNTEAPIQIKLYGSGTGSSTGGIFFNRLRVYDNIDRQLVNITSDATTRPSGGICNCIRGLILFQADGITPHTYWYDSNYPNLTYGTFRQGADDANRRLSLM